MFAEPRVFDNKMEEAIDIEEVVMGATPVLVSPPLTKTVDASRFPVTITDEMVLNWAALAFKTSVDKPLKKLVPFPLTFIPPFTRSVDV